MTKNKLSFSEFKPATAKDWKEKIITDLKGGDYDKLYSYTSEGIKIAPFYTAENVDPNNYNIPNKFQQENPGLSPRHWVNNVKFSVKQGEEKSVNQKALDALNNGAEGLIFQIEGSIDFKALLNEVNAEYCSISFESSTPHYSLIENYFEYLKSAGVDLQKVTGGYFFDALVYGLHDESFTKADIQSDCKKVMPWLKQVPGFKLFLVNAALFQNAGGNTKNEIAFAWSLFADYLDLLTENGFSAEEAVKSIAFQFSFGRKYFLEIAKIKAFKKGVLQIAEANGATITPDTIEVHGVTSEWTKSAFDIHVNMLRNTTEAMAAILAGCDSIYVQPHDFISDKPKQTFERIARNVSSILRDESYLDKVVDPTQGTYYIESLIKDVFGEAWKEFLSIEEKGGFQKAFEQQYVQKQLAENRKHTYQELIFRKDVFIGTNQFPNPGEKLAFEKIGFPEESSKEIVSSRATMQFEMLRWQTEQYVQQKGEEKRPSSFNILWGTGAEVKAKSNFAYSFLGAAGIITRDEVIVHNWEEFFNQLSATGDTIITICIPAEMEDELWKQSFAWGESLALFAGKPVNENALANAGFYGAIHRHVNTLDFLKTLLQKLAI